MNEAPRFTLAWKLAIIVALVLSILHTDFELTSGDRKWKVSTDTQSTKPAVESTEPDERIAKLEKRVQELEGFLYQHPYVDRLDEVEKRLKELGKEEVK